MIRVPLEDPALFYIQGEQMRAAAFVSPVSYNSIPVPLLAGTTEFQNGPITPIIADDDVELCGMIPDGIMDYPLQNQNATGKQIRANACIATHFGTFVDLERGTPIINRFVQHTGRWNISGVTKNSAGSPLGACRVVAFETGRLSQDQVEAAVTETISDGSGNYSLEVSLNTAHQLTAYKPGSPDVAGITRNDIVPTAIG
jgi:hypothetical protein